MARARDWDGFLAAARDFHAPQQNIVYADVEGNIGFVAAGRVPVRKPANDLKGMAPAPGWLAKYDWDGYHPFRAAAAQLQPGERRGGDREPPHHAARLPALHQFGVAAALPRRPHPAAAGRDAEAHRAELRAHPGRRGVAGDARAAAELLATRPRSEEARQALALLAKWDGSMAAERAEPLIAWAWWRELARALYADELGDAFNANWQSRAVFTNAVLSGDADQARWCDDVRTPAVETCEEILAVSLEAALADLRQRYGSNAASWRWGEAHIALHEHRPFGRQPLLARIFDISVPSPGDAYTVDVGRNNLNDEARPFANRHAPSLRAIYDLSDLEKSLYIHSGGQSGNILSPHYAAFTEAWAKNEYIPMRMERKTLEAEPHQTLRLTPLR